MSVFNYKVVPISDDNHSRLPRIKQTDLEPTIERVKQISNELPTYLNDRNAKVEINNIEYSLKVTTTQSEPEVNKAIARCLNCLDLECYRIQ